MCVSEYDLVCDDCRRKHDEIFNVEAKDLQDEEKKFQEWIKSLCPACRKLLEEEGFVPYKQFGEKSENVRCPKCGAGTGFYLYKTETGNFYLRCQACRHEIPVDVKLLGL